MARIFISYSHADEAWKDRVVKQLGVLAGEGLAVWDDRRIAAGDGWQAEIETAIAQCDVALLLISVDFLTSKFILGKEVPPLLQRRQTDGIRVIPVILSPCQWTRIGWLSPIQARPKDGKALSGMKRHSAETALAALAGEIHDLSNKLPLVSTSGQAMLPETIDLSHLPAGAEHFFGRDTELVALDAAWAAAGKTAIVELIAPGGVGKTSLLKRWLDKLRADGWRGATKVYGWSFYSQGTRDDKQASEDHFLAEALRWFGVVIDPATNPWDKGRALAEAVAASRTLLVLDGIEPLQYPPGAMAGELQAPGLKALLQHLASAGHTGLCLITSRVRLENLSEYENNTSRPEGVVQRLTLDNLNDIDGGHLLHALGANKAGASDIDADDDELKHACRDVRGHALTLSLLGNYLTLAFAGDIRRRDQVEFQEADAATTGGHAFKVMAAYETWFVSSGKRGEVILAALRLFGFFDRPVSSKTLRALRQAPAIQGLTRPLVNLDAKAWQIALKRLEQCGLIFANKGGEVYDAHPLVREYLAEAMKTRQSKAWKEGHRRIYEQLKASVPHRPEGLAALQPLYQALAHGCLAGLWQEALDEVYVDRILRGTGDDGNYSNKKLGAHGNDLGAVAGFFDDPWRRPTPALSEGDQAWLLNEAATCLRALGRLDEALEPMRAGMEIAVKRSDWKNAAIGYGNLSELQLSLGQVAAAVADAEQSLDHAERSGDAFQLMARRATLADALYQRGERPEALARCAEAEAIQVEQQADYPLLYSGQGYRYCDVLLAEAERAVWRGTTGKERPMSACTEVAQRASQTLNWAEKNSAPLLDFALNHLTLARCALYANLLRGELPDATAQTETERAVAGLRAAGNQDLLPCGLLTRALLRQRLGQPDAARADLDEAERIAARGGMKLFLADIALHRARLFHDKDELAKARALIEECGYGRRLPELEDAESMLSQTPAAPTTTPQESTP